VEELGRLARAAARRAVRAAHFGRAVVFGAIERDQDMLAEPPQGREPTMFLQLADDLAKEREVELLRFSGERFAVYPASLSN
jgi:hypothetical protein